MGTFVMQYSSRISVAQSFVSKQKSKSDIKEHPKNLALCGDNCAVNANLNRTRAMSRSALDGQLFSPSGTNVISNFVKCL